jgi:hypothetical protein
MCSIEARQRLHGLDAGEGLVDVHRVQERLVWEERALDGDNVPGMKTGAQGGVA